MATLTSGHRPTPSNSDSIHDGRWEFVSPPSPRRFEEQQPYQAQYEQRPIAVSQQDIHNTPSAYSRHSLNATSDAPGSRDLEPLPTRQATGHDIPIREAQPEPIEEIDTNAPDLNDKWVHRDKLAQIEKKELEEIGARLGLPLSAATISGGVQHPRDGLSDLENGPPSSKRARIDTSDGFLSSDDNAHGSTGSPYATNGASSLSRKLSATRAAKSRIPISKSSPLAPTAPFPSSPLGPDSPSTYHQHQQITYDPNTSWRESLNSTPRVSSSQPRKFSSSPPTTTTSTTRTLNGARAPTSTKQPRARTVSNAAKRNSWTKTSMTLERNNDRPHTPVNRPEGDAPWLATMFKPDPSLPPDQQMLPTHAKKLALQRGEHVPTNEELLERETAEASRAEGSWVPPGQGDRAETSKTVSPGLQQDEEGNAEDRPGVKRFFSRSSMKSKRESALQSQAATPDQKRANAELVAGPPYRGEALIQQQNSPRTGGADGAVGGSTAHNSMDFVQRLQQRQSPSTRNSEQRRRRDDPNDEELDEWPLPSPPRTHLHSRSESMEGASGSFSSRQQQQQEQQQALQQQQRYGGPTEPTNAGLRITPQVQASSGEKMNAPGGPPQALSKEGMGKEEEGRGGKIKKKEKKEGGCAGCCAVM